MDVWDKSVQQIVGDWLQDRLGQYADLPKLAVVLIILLIAWKLGTPVFIAAGIVSLYWLIWGTL